MEKYAVIKYTLFVKENNSENRVYYILEKYNDDTIEIKQIKNNIKTTIYTSDIKEKEIEEAIKKLVVLLRIDGPKYSARHLLLLLKNEVPDLLKYGDAKEYKMILTENYRIRMVKYYFDARGRLYNKILGRI